MLSIFLFFICFLTLFCISIIQIGEGIKAETVDYSSLPISINLLTFYNQALFSGYFEKVKKYPYFKLEYEIA